MRIILFFLLSISLFAQEDVITVGRGSGSYTYTVTTGTDLMINGDLYLYGHLNKTQSDTGAYSIRKYIVWKYTGGTYDSTSADHVLFLAGTFADRINTPTLDATGTYYASILYKTRKGQGYWVYARGADSSFTTPVTIVPPDTVPVQFTFTDVTGADLNTTYISNGAPIIGLDSAWAYAAGDSFKLHLYDAWQVVPKKAYGNLDTGYVKIKTIEYSHTYNNTLTIGGVSDRYSVTTVAAPHIVRYFSPQGSNGNGQTWATAWTSMTASKWSQLAGGGYLLMDGNAAGDSIVYNVSFTPSSSGSWDSPIYIMPASYYYLGGQPDSVKGKVVIDHNYTGGNHAFSILGSVHWITIKGLTIRHTGASSIYIYANAATANPYRIQIDSCTIYEPNANECVEILGYGNAWNATELSLADTTRYAHHIEISNNNMYTHTNRAMPENNIIYGHLTGWLNIHHNTLWQRNYQEGQTEHIDPIQLSYSNHSVRIYNNILLNDSCVTGHTMILGLMSRGSNYADTTIVYNNYVYSGGSLNCSSNWKQEILWREPEGDADAVQYLPLVYSVNNTIVARNGYAYNSGSESRYNVLESNNIIVQLGVNGAFPGTGGPNGGPYIGHWNSTYNTGDYKYTDSLHTNLAWLAWDGTVDFGNDHWRHGATIGAPSSWADFINNWGGSGVNDDPEFVNNTRIPTGNPFEISATSPAIDAGTDMRYILNKFEYLPQFDADTDILGNPRDANWDIGCFEVQ